MRMRGARCWRNSHAGTESVDTGGLLQIAFTNVKDQRAAAADWCCASHEAVVAACARRQSSVLQCTLGKVTPVSCRCRPYLRAQVSSTSAISRAAGAMVGVVSDARRRCGRRQSLVRRERSQRQRCGPVNRDQGRPTHTRHGSGDCATATARALHNRARPGCQMRAATPNFGNEACPNRGQYFISHPISLVWNYRSCERHRLKPMEAPYD